MRKYYIAYGNNMNVQEMSKRCPGAVILGTAILSGWDIWFRGEDRKATLNIEKTGGSVPVVVWEITGRHEQTLDRLEGFPKLCDKQELRVECDDIRSGNARSVKAFLYVLKDPGKPGLPSAEYAQACREGYDNFGFDPVYLENALRRSWEASKNS